MTACRTLALGISILALTGCDNPDKSQPPNADETAAAGTYSLIKVDGATLPTTSAKDTLNCTRGVDSGSLVLETNPQTYTLAVTLRSVCDAAAGAPPNTTTAIQGEEGHWSLTGTTFSLTPNAGTQISTGVVTFATGSITAGVDLTWVEGSPQSKTLLLTR